MVTSILNNQKPNVKKEIEVSSVEKAVSEEMVAGVVEVTIACFVARR